MAVDPGVLAVFALAVFFLAWYFAAFIYSRRLAGRIAEELKGAVLALGGTSTVRWFGTTAFRMTTEGAKAPFRKVALTVTLRPREMPINWAIGTAQGRRDAALVEASLRDEPRIGFEIVDPHSRIGRRRIRAKADWSKLAVGNRDLLLSSDDEDGARSAIEALGAEALEPIVALHVTPGSDSGIAASILVRRGQASRGLTTIKRLAERLLA